MRRTIFHYTAAQLTPYIAWEYFFHAWGIKPSEAGSEKAQEVKRDAERLLAAHSGSIVAGAVFALCDTTSSGDDIVIEGTTLPLLRQQHCRPGEPNLCLSDFISPRGDKMGLFATTVSGFFATASNGDTYESLLTQTVASRIAEAAATLLHKEVRTSCALWGYAPNEQLTPTQLNAEENCGIRPAIGYPSLPDQSIIFTMDNLLNLQEIGITLTPNGAMQPHASVCGLMIAHPAARYFAVGPISDEQLRDYAQRRAVNTEYLHKFLYKNLQK